MSVGKNSYCGRFFFKKANGNQINMRRQVGQTRSGNEAGVMPQ